MKVWVDDLREPPDDSWEWAMTSLGALSALRRYSVDELSLDHDLGGDDTTRPIVMWMAEHNTWPPVVRVHTANPVGREWLEGMIRRYAPEGTLQ